MGKQKKEPPLINAAQCITTLREFIKDAVDTDTIQVGELRSLLGKTVVDGLTDENLKPLVIVILDNERKANPNGEGGLDAANLWRRVRAATVFSIGLERVEKALASLIEEHKVVSFSAGGMATYVTPSEEDKIKD